MQQTELIPHLFRKESAKITAVLCQKFGFDFLEIAEDITSETFQAALETWPYKGIPENPTAWLFAVAKHKAINASRRSRLFQTKISEQFLATNPQAEEPTFVETSTAIQDSQLQMLFCICHPAISPASQIAMALRILCGFGIDEIAHALLSEKETIQKRLTRAKEKLRTLQVRMEMPGDNEIALRLASVLKTIYLLFSEGYYSETNDAIIREELCAEAMRLAYMLIEYPATNKPETSALMALMCFQASRIPARKSIHGDIILYEEQDESEWNTELIARGATYLHSASGGTRLSKYHLEASIAYWHTKKEDSPEKWEAILQLYNRLLQVEYSPIAALNRTYALAKACGYEKAIVEAEKLKLTNNTYYFILLAELYSKSNPAKALLHLHQAELLSKTEAEKQLLRRKQQELDSPS